MASLPIPSRSSTCSRDAPPYIHPAPVCFFIFFIFHLNTVGCTPVMPLCYRWHPAWCMFCNKSNGTVANGYVPINHSLSYTGQCFGDIPPGGRFYPSLRWLHANPSFNFSMWSQVLAMINNSTLYLIKNLLSLGKTGQCPIYHSGYFESIHPCPRHESASAFAGANLHRTQTLCPSLNSFLNGTFSSSTSGREAGWPIQSIWSPHHHCQVHSYRPMSLIPCLHAKGIRRIILLGDSLFRQLFNQFVTLSRKLKDNVDHHTWDNGRYRIWADRDLLELSRQNDYDTLLSSFDKNKSEPLLDVLFIWHPEITAMINGSWSDSRGQLGWWRGVDKVLEPLEPANNSTIFIQGIWGWHTNPGDLVQVETNRSMRATPYFQHLLDEFLKPRPWIAARYLINIPTGKRIMAGRQLINDYLNSAFSSSDLVTLVDFELISKAHPYPPPELDYPPDGDAHYSCEIDGQSIVLNTHSGCTDTAHTVLWEAMFNHMCGLFNQSSQKEARAI